MLQLEQLTKKMNDTLLEAVGWIIQAPDQFNRYTAPGVAERERRSASSMVEVLVLEYAEAHSLAVSDPDRPRRRDTGQ